jgi:predicted nucleic acid-binding protein
VSEPDRDFAAIAEQIRQAREAYHAEWVELLEQAEKAHRDASAHADKYRRLRNDTIRTASMSGLSQSDISRITGLSRARVGQIVEGDESDTPASA